MAFKNLIELVNSIPPDRKLPHIHDLMEEFEGDEARVVEKLIEKLTGVPQSFTKPDDYDKYARLEFETFTYADYIMLRYMDFRRLRKAAHELAQLGSLSGMERFHRQLELVLSPEECQARNIELQTDVWQETSRFDFQPRQWAWSRPSLNTGLEIDDHTGLIIAREDEWLGALVGIQADRLRECVICQRIFWARQDNMVACSPRCSTANRQRLFRERGPLYKGASKRKVRR